MEASIKTFLSIHRKGTLASTSEETGASGHREKYSEYGRDQKEGGHQ